MAQSTNAKLAQWMTLFAVVVIWLVFSLPAGLLRSSWMPDQLIRRSAFHSEKEFDWIFPPPDASLSSDSGVQSTNLEEEMNFRGRRDEFALNALTSGVGWIGFEVRLSLHRQKDVLLLWLLDQSSSSQGWRQDALNEIERMYRDLETADLIRGGRVQSAIAAFDKELHFLPLRPVEWLYGDLDEFRKLPTDRTGVENVFRAIRDIAEMAAKHRKANSDAILVVVTDEAGDDPEHLESAIAALKQSGVRCFVLGQATRFDGVVDDEAVEFRMPGSPSAFGIAGENWADISRNRLPRHGRLPSEKLRAHRKCRTASTERSNGKDIQFLDRPMNVGRESPLDDRMVLLPWGREKGHLDFRTWFGPYGLSRLARQTGGSFYNIGGPSFVGGNCVAELEERNFTDGGRPGYAPDLGPLDAFVTRVNSNPAMSRFMRVMQQARSLPAVEIPLVFDGVTPEVLQDEIHESQKAVALWTYCVERLQEGLAEVDVEALPSRQLRWRAAVDWAKLHIQVLRIRLFEYSSAIAEMKGAPRELDDPWHQVWELVPTERLRSRRLRIMADETTQRLFEYGQEHVFSMWDDAAKRERHFPMGWKWRKTDVPEPAKPRRID